MKPITRYCIVPALVMVLVVGCQAQQRPPVRPPAVAGQFYPASEQELRAQVRSLFAQAHAPMGPGAIRALIAPHAGYPYSGVVAASAYNQIDPHVRYDNVFVIGSSHHVAFDGAAVYTAGDYRTPLGIVTVDRTVGRALLDHGDPFVTRDDAHADEHSIEVQLPFLQERFGGALRIVPIVLGTNDPRLCAKIAEGLRAYFTPKNLFVISSDFSHYPPYDQAKVVDAATEHAIVENSAYGLLSALIANEKRAVPNLATSLCGWTSVMTLLDLTEGNKDLVFTPVEYRNSGDAPIGNKDQVVGYWAITVSEPGARAQEFRLSNDEKQSLLRIARETVTEYVRSRRVPEVDGSSLTPAEKTPCGAFVTLRKKGDLRGCIGRFDASVPLVEVIQQMAVAAATQDPRFSPVRPDEVSSLEIEISVLTPMKRISSIDEIELGRHGIYMRKGGRSGTFLPQVATETGWTKEEFLGHCAQEKAGIGWEGWKDAELFTYEALVFSEHETH